MKNICSKIFYELQACMKMDRRQRSPLRKRKIETLLAELGIERCANTKLSMLSGGERKKVSLAAQVQFYKKRNTNYSYIYSSS